MDASPRAARVKETIISNDYYNATGTPATSAELASQAVRAEFIAITAAFAMLPTLTGHANEVPIINGSATGYSSLATTGSGNIVRATSATLVTPALGVATATSINKVAITAPATSATLTIADGKTLTANSTITLGGTDGKTLTLNDSTTIGTNAITFGGTEALTLAATKNVTFADAFATSGAHSITLTSTGDTSVTLPTTGTLATTAGNVATATALATARAINGVNFDGTGAITVTAAASTLSGSTLASGVTASSLTSLGTITSLTATTINAFTLGGTISGGGNNINNVIIGAVTPLAASFTTLNTTGNVGLGAAALTDRRVSIAGSLNAVAGAAFGLVSNPTLVATANNDEVFYMYTGGTITVGGFTGTKAYGLFIANIAGAATNYAIYTSGGNVRLGSLPTSASGLASGCLWNNSGVINIV